MLVVQRLLRSAMTMRKECTTKWIEWIVFFSFSSTKSDISLLTSRTFRWIVFCEETAWASDWVRCSTYSSKDWSLGSLLHRQRSVRLDEDFHFSLDLTCLEETSVQLTEDDDDRPQVTYRYNRTFSFVVALGIVLLITTSNDERFRSLPIVCINGCSNDHMSIRATSHLAVFSFGTRPFSSE